MPLSVTTRRSRSPRESNVDLSALEVNSPLGGRFTRTAEPRRSRSRARSSRTATKEQLLSNASDGRPLTEDLVDVHVPLGDEVPGGDARHVEQILDEAGQRAALRSIAPTPWSLPT